MKIGIELNGVVRNLNKQIIKYYKKDINKEFDDKSVDYNLLNVADSLSWSKKDKNEFLYVDYPYEVYGCAKAMESNLPVAINNHIKIFEDEGIELTAFSLLEEGLTIQSSYFFLSKIGSRLREVHFPKDGKEMWDICDVIITTNANIVKSKPSDKKVILIRRTDNVALEEKADYVYDSLMDVLKDTELIVNLNNKNNGKVSAIGKAIRKIKQIFK